MTTWFEELTGIAEVSPDYVRSRLHLEGETLTSSANGRVMRCGRLELPSLADLRSEVASLDLPAGSLRVREVVGDVRLLHTDPANADALFQVASQFNLLEMVNPEATPEDGVGMYQDDPTQGPACAISCGAGTIYRNYFVPLGDQVGQSAHRQIDCLADLGDELGNPEHRWWTMSNGYALASAEGLRMLATLLAVQDEDDRDALRQLVRIGIQTGTEVTLRSAGHTVSQAFCSALPVNYSSHDAGEWGPFARLILESAYEATLLAGAINLARTGCAKVYLTSLGGGAFGNRPAWIRDALDRALRTVEDLPLDVAMVSYARPNPVFAGIASTGS